MLGKTHFKVAALSAVIVSTVPALNSIFNAGIINTPKGISIAGIGVAALAGLMVDADSEHSMINQMNPVTGAFNGAMGFIESIVKTIINLLMTLGVGIYIFSNANTIMNEIGKIEGLKTYAYGITYGAALFLIISGFMGTRIVKHIPIVNELYSVVIMSIRSIAAIFKKIFIKLIYVGGGAYLIFFNYNHNQEFVLYLIGVIFIAIGIFPHRSFFHAIEGLCIVTIAASIVLNRFGLGYLNGYFFIGYASHIYWADIFTAEGVPLSSIPMVLERIGVDSILRKFKPYRGIKRVLNIRLKLPPSISTGSMAGRMVEDAYVIGLCFVAVMVFNKYSPIITVM